ncbi:hypothetical protein Trydic_g3039 [Trypoxylus dichotomus]
MLTLVHEEDHTFHRKENHIFHRTKDHTIHRTEIRTIYRTKEQATQRTYDYTFDTVKKNYIKSPTLTSLKSQNEAM